ncbi:MAG: FAD-dependent oxidoreductase [Rhodospirillaceae bacterium]|nr:FAD-dependent oxidoreductase [Rhodospirillaceae bacterium]
MPFTLIKNGLKNNASDIVDFPRQPDLKSSYDVIIVGAGGHGCAAAYYLARDWGIKNVCVIDKGYLGGGNTARNTAIIRSNYLTAEGVAFYKESMDLFKELDRELDINLMYSERGHLTLAHNDASIRTSRWRAEVNKQLGVDSELLYTDDVARVCPQLNVSQDVRYPILGALYHPPGAIARHDAVAWGYARDAIRMGAEVHQKTPVTDVIVEGGRVKGIQTDKGPVYADKVLQAVAGSSSLLAGMAGLELPIRTIPLQACVSQPYKPILDTIIVSGSLHIYVSQSSRGEFVMGGSTDPYPLYSTRSTLDFKEGLMSHMLELFPFLSEARIMRQWAGMADMSPDFSPIMGLTPIENYYIDAGWGTWGFKATPVSGKRMAECVATNKQPALLEPFRLSRFDNFTLTAEKGAASVGH